MKVQMKNNPELSSVLKLFQLTGFGPYFIQNDHQNLKQAILLVTYNMLVIACLFYNVTELIRESRDLADSLKTNILFKISFDGVEVWDNLHLCFVGIRCLILWARGNPIWFKLISVNKKLRDLNVQFNTRKFNFCLSVKLITFIGFYVIFLGLNAIVFKRSGLRNSFFRTFSLLPLLINSIFDVAFASLMIIIYERFKIINNFLNTCTKYYTKEGAEACSTLCRSNWRNNEKTLDDKGPNFKMGYLTLPRKLNCSLVSIFKCHPLKRPPSARLTKNFEKCFVVDDFYSRRNSVNLIRSLKVLHFELYEVADSINSVFGFSLFFIFATSFFGCIINLYFVISFHLNTLDTEQYFSTFSWMIYYCFRVLHVIYCLEKSSKEVMF